MVAKIRFTQAISVIPVIVFILVILVILAILDIPVIPVILPTLKVKIFVQWPFGDQLFGFSRQGKFLGAKLY